MVLKHAQFAQTAANNVWSTSYACSKLYLSLKYGISESAKLMQVYVGLYDPHYSSKYFKAMQIFLL